jgi:hypothetical protein
MQTDNEQASFLHACSNVDMANCFSSDVNGALKQTEAYYVSATFQEFLKFSESQLTKSS